MTIANDNIQTPPNTQNQTNYNKTGFSEKSIGSIAQLGNVLTPTPNVQFEYKPPSDVSTIIQTANSKFLIETLSPQIKANEAKKRKHKDVLLTAVGVFISIQFILLAIMFFMVLDAIIGCHINGNPLSNDLIKLLIGFVTAYMTSVVVELIAMLKYIVTNVFDTSITSMVSLFKDNPSSKEQEK